MLFDVVRKERHTPDPLRFFLALIDFGIMNNFLKSNPLFVSFLAKTLATANSINAANTNTRHVIIQISMALV